MANVLVLDGGASTEIHRGGIEIHGDPLWSSRLLKSNPDIIKGVHRSFLDVGCDIIQTISYQTSISLLCKYGDVSVEGAKELIKKSVFLARESVEQYWEDYQKKCESSDDTTLKDRKKPLVCGCLGPYGINFFNASEYNGNYIDTVSEKDILDMQRPRIQALVDAGIDYLALETIPVQKEAEIVEKLAREFPNVKTWISFQCRDGDHTGHGEKFSDAVLSVVKNGYIKCVGTNCCSPLDVTSLLTSIQRHRKDYSLELVTYPNSGETWRKSDFNSTGEFLGDSLMSGFGPAIPKWIELGANIIGGCCQTTPDDMRIVVDCLHQLNQRK